jgi:hypothetical protein
MIGLVAGYLLEVAAASRQEPDSRERCCCCYTVSLASAFTHAFLPEGRHRVLLIKLNPGPLHITKCLTHVQIVTALKYGRNPGDVGHRSPEAPLTYDSEFGVKLAMHGSHALIDPPSTSYTSPVPGPSCLTTGVIFIAGVGCGFVFGNRIKIVDGQVAIVLAFFCHQHVAGDELSSTSSVDSSSMMANGLPS